MHYTREYEEALAFNESMKGTACICYDGPIFELDPEDYAEIERKQYAREHPDRQWYKKFEKHRKRK